MQSQLEGRTVLACDIRVGRGTATGTVKRGGGLEVGWKEHNRQ